jgi:hypothetical protein
MPNVYTSKVAVTQQNKVRAYEALCVLISHLPAFGVDLLALSRQPDGFVSVTLTGPIPVEQLDHVGLADPGA